MTEVLNEETGELTTVVDPVEETIAAEMGDEETPDEEPTEETDEEAEREPEPDPQGLSEREMNKRFDQLATRVGTYTKYVETFAEETGQPLVRCAVCLPFSPGFHFNPLEVDLSEEQANVCRFLLGEPLKPAFQNTQRAQACPDCDGWGMVNTGSRVHGKESIQCAPCKGRGWVGEAADLTPAQAAKPQALNPDEPAPADEELPQLDPWGTPSWHADYYKMPPGRTPGWDNGTGVWVPDNERQAV